MRRADEKNGATRRQDEFQLRQTFTQRLTLAGRIAIAGDFDIIANDHIGACTGDIAGNTLRQHGRITQSAGAGDGEAIRCPILWYIGQQFSAKRVGFQYAPHGCDHARGKLRIGCYHQDTR